MTTNFPGNGAWATQQQIAQLQQQLNNVAGMTRAQAQAYEKRLDDLIKVLQNTALARQGLSPGVIRVEDIPGRRVPFDMLVDIPIGSNTTSTQTGSITIPQEGPFVAVRRVATFMSALEFQVTTGSNVARFAGRSYGRYRPIHSAWDIMDAPRAANSDAQILSGTIGGAGGFTLTNAMSQFRTMQFDGRVYMQNAGSSYPRQNINVPSSMWTDQINAPSELGALDFFERGEVLTFAITPNHVNNPPVGNVSGDTVFGTANGWPFLAGQYDAHEGIATRVGTGPGTMPYAPTQSSGINTFTVNLTSDNVVRLPDGILTIGWQGYRIIQPTAP